MNRQEQQTKSTMKKEYNCRRLTLTALVAVEVDPHSLPLGIEIMRELAVGNLLAPARLAELASTHKQVDNPKNINTRISNTTEIKRKRRRRKPPYLLIGTLGWPTPSLPPPPPPVTVVVRSARNPSTSEGAGN